MSGAESTAMRALNKLISFSPAKKREHRTSDGRVGLCGDLAKGEGAIGEGEAGKNQKEQAAEDGLLHGASVALPMNNA